jgi:hypothetical protein
VAQTKATALGGEEVGDRARIVAANRFTGQNDGAGIDVARAQAGFAVGGVDKLPQRPIVDTFSICGERREVHGRQI